MSDALNTASPVKALTEIQCCANCWFWVKAPKQMIQKAVASDKQESGFCHRNPPTPVVTVAQHPITGVVSQQVQPVFVPTLSGEWCGEWDATEDAPPVQPST